MTLCVFPSFYYSCSYENLPARHPRRQAGIQNGGVSRPKERLSMQINYTSPD